MVELVCLLNSVVWIMVCCVLLDYFGFVLFMFGCVVCYVFRLFGCWWFGLLCEWLLWWMWFVFDSYRFGWCVIACLFLVCFYLWVSLVYNCCLVWGGGVWFAYLIVLIERVIYCFIIVVDFWVLLYFKLLCGDVLLLITCLLCWV